MADGQELDSTSSEPVAPEPYLGGCGPPSERQQAIIREAMVKAGIELPSEIKAVIEQAVEFEDAWEDPLSPEQEHDDPLVLQYEIYPDEDLVKMAREMGILILDRSRIQLIKEIILRKQDAAPLSTQQNASTPPSR